MIKPLSSDHFRDKLLAIMDRKDHWAGPLFTGPQITKAQIEAHYRQEYAVYLRDFPVFLSRIHGKNPPRPVRTELARWLFKEDTGGLTLGQSHSDLFLTMMLGLGFERAHFRDVNLLSESRAYREWLDSMTTTGDWLTALAVVNAAAKFSDKYGSLEAEKLKPFHVTRWLNSHRGWGEASRRCGTIAVTRSVIT